MTDILLVTTWDAACGISEHAAMLKEAVESQSDYRYAISTALDPTVLRTDTTIIHLNYHAALHSRWTPEWVSHFQTQGKKVVITYHDTGVPNSDQCKALHAVADAFVIHEPADDLPGAHYIRMGVPKLMGFYQHDCGYIHRPILGSIGFPFPWKHYDQLALITKRLGWQLFLIAPTATDEQVAHWRSLNPFMEVRTDFVPRQEAVSLLSGCDATAFTYVCHNTGQSAAILQGVAACKPVIALKTCRQFRALYCDPLGSKAIRWAETFEDVEAYLRHLRIMPVDPATLALATQESWAHKAKDYIDLYKELLA